MVKELLKTKPLFVFALESEAANMFDDRDTLFVGVGKINAAYHLTKRIQKESPSIIINLGSAGSSRFEKGSVINCTKFIQRDMDTTILGSQKYETPFSGIPPVLEYGIQVPILPQGTCGTGDSFDVNHTTTDYDVVEMEAYSLAFIAQQEQIPFLCLKYISDGADDGAAEDWHITVLKAAEALKKSINDISE